MSLDIGLAAERSIQPYPTLRLAMEDDGYYWFCYTTFEALAEATGEMIDPYGGAWFAGEQLVTLASALDGLRERALAKPEAWSECVGHNIGSSVAPIDPPEPIYATLSRDELVRLLGRFADVVAEARRDGLWVACLGD